MGIKKAVCVMLAAVVAVLMLPLAGAAAGGVTVKAEIGYDGVVTYVRNIPMTVTVENGGSDADGVIAVELNRSDTQFDRYEYPIRIAAGESVTVTIPVLLNFKQTSYRVQFVANGVVLGETDVTPTKVIAPSTLLVGVVSSDPSAMSYLNVNSGNDALRRSEYWQTVPLTAETFPTTDKMMSAFDIIALDGAVEGGFSDEQAQALSSWVRGGGVLIVGGGTRAAGGYAAVQNISDIRAGTPYRAGGVETALSDYIFRTQGTRVGSQEEAGAAYLVVPVDGGTSVCDMNGASLISRQGAGRGVIYAAAFSLSDKPLSGWDGMNCFWQRVLIAEDSARYQGMVYGRMNAYYSEGGSYTDEATLRSLRVDSGETLVPAAAVILVFLAVAGFGSYFLLKKLDKRGFMWVSMPVLSVTAALVLCFMGQTMSLNEPAAAMYSMVYVDEAGTANVTTVAGVASKDVGAMKIGTSGGENIFPADVSYWWEENPQNPGSDEKKTLRYLYTLGSESGITFQESSAWNVEQLMIRSDTARQLDIRAKIWWEEDGLHGTVENTSDLTLDAGYIFTGYGYTSVPEILPGETVEFRMLEDAGERTEEYRDGIIQSSGGNNQGYYDFYTVINCAVFPEYMGKEDVSGILSADEVSRRNVKRNLINNAMNTITDGSSSAASVFRYITSSRGIASPAISVNGSEIRRVAAENVICVNVTYFPVGKSGIVRYSYGQAPMSVATVAGGVPGNTGTTANPDNWYELKDAPVFCFQLTEAAGLKLDSLSFYCETDSSEVPIVSLYSWTKSEWVELDGMTLPAAVSDDAAQYLNPKGEVFVRLETREGSRTNQAYGLRLAAEGRTK